MVMQSKIRQYNIKLNLQENLNVNILQDHAMNSGHYGQLAFNTEQF